MVHPRKGARSAAQAGKKRKKDDFFEDAECDDDEFFVHSGDERNAGSESEEGDAEAAETAEEKRLRLGAGAHRVAWRVGRPLGTHAATMHASSGGGWQRRRQNAAFAFCCVCLLRASVARGNSQNFTPFPPSWPHCMPHPCRPAFLPPAHLLLPPLPLLAMCLLLGGLRRCAAAPRAAAKAYLDQVKAIEAAEAEPGSDDDDDGAHAAVAGRLRADALEGLGHLQRKLAHRLALPPLPAAADWGGPASGGGRLLRGHHLSVTAIALSPDDRTLYSASKDGGLLAHDMETGVRQKFDTAAAGQGREAQQGTAADWVKRGPRQSGRNSLLAAAVSGDGRYLAVGGGDRRVHIWDARTRTHIKVRRRWPDRTAAAVAARPAACPSRSMLLPGLTPARRPRGLRAANPAAALLAGRTATRSSPRHACTAPIPPASWRAGTHGGPSPGGVQAAGTGRAPTGGVAVCCTPPCECRRCPGTRTR